MDVTGLLGVLVGIVVPTIGAIFAYGRLSQRVKDQTDDIDDLKKRVEKAEGAATEVAGLATAIEHMGDKFAGEVRHLVDKFATETSHTRSQLADIKEELRVVRAPSRARAAAR